MRLATALRFLRANARDGAGYLRGDHLNANPGSWRDLIVSVRAQIQHTQGFAFVLYRDNRERAQAFTSPEHFEAAWDLFVPDIGDLAGSSHECLRRIRLVMRDAFEE
jgi:hypothetical protein